MRVRNIRHADYAGSGFRGNDGVNRLSKPEGLSRRYPLMICPDCAIISGNQCLNTGGHADLFRLLSVYCCNFFYCPFTVQFCSKLRFLSMLLSLFHKSDRKGNRILSETETIMILRPFLRFFRRIRGKPERAWKEWAKAAPVCQIMFSVSHTVPKAKTPIRERIDGQGGLLTEILTHPMIAFLLVDRPICLCYNPIRKR